MDRFWLDEIDEAEWVLRDTLEQRVQRWVNTGLVERNGR